jgi:hypothetical protein
MEFLVTFLPLAMFGVLAILLFTGYLSPLVAIFVTNTGGIRILEIYHLSLSQFVQIAGFILITLGVLVIVYMYSRFNRSRLIFNRTKLKPILYKHPRKNWRIFSFRLERNKLATTRSANKFYRITSAYLIRGHVEEVVEIVGYNLESLISSAQQYMPNDFRVADDTKEELSKPNGSDFAF